MTALEVIAALIVCGMSVVIIIASVSPRVPHAEEYLFHRSFYRPDARPYEPGGAVAAMANAIFAASDRVDVVRYRELGRKAYLFEAVVPWSACAPWQRGQLSNIVAAAVERVRPPVMRSVNDVRVRVVYR